MGIKSKKQILIIDDEQTWLKISSHILKTCGYKVLTANSGAEAIKALSKFKPDLILSDVRMPDMNGFDLVDNIRHHPSSANTPVIFFSAIDDYDARKTARALGAVDYLIKPFDKDDVRSVLAKHLNV